MKNLHWILILGTLLGCTAIEENLPVQNDFSITGNSLSSFSNSRSHNTVYTSLPDGSRASVFSTGGIEADGEIITYYAPQWEHNLSWNSSRENASVCIFCPTLPTQETDFYDASGHLKDILFFHQEIPYKTDMQLSFKHLFSLLTIQANKRVNRKITQIAVTPSVTVQQVDAYSGQISYNTENAKTACMDKQADGTYQFLIPPASQMELDITITYQDETQRTFPIEARDYNGNTQYYCQLTSQIKEPGIYTAEDFIAFTHLYNGEKYEDRTLDEFGVTENGVTTYYLQNDIHFTEEESKLVQEIGYITNSETGKNFNDCFDGQDYTLYDLQLSIYTPLNSPQKMCYGLFSWIGKEGKIKNLNLNKAVLTSDNRLGTMYMGIISGKNDGIIDNCHVKDCTLIPSTEGNLGGIAAYNGNLIINSSATFINFNFTTQNPKNAGGISSDNSNNIINCYTGNCNFKKADFSGGIAFQQASTGKGGVINCYAYLSETKGTKYHGDILHRLHSGNIAYCYYLTKPICKKLNGQITSKEVKKYDLNTLMVSQADGSLSPLIEVLNKWVKETGSKEYPTLDFNQWIQGENPPVVLQHP